MYTTAVYNYVDEISETVWESLGKADNVYFKKKYFKAFEAHNSNKIQFHYIIVFKENQPISIASIQVLEFDFAENDFTPNASKLIQKITYSFSRLIKRDYVKIIICGNVFLSGEHGIYIKPNEDKKTVLENIVKGIQELINSNKYLKKLVDIILLKDFITASLPITDRLKEYNYTAIQIDPNMVLTLKPEWKTFEDYLADFKSKFRVKANKAYKTSSQLTTKDFSSEDIKANKAMLTALYQNVIDKASFNPETLNLSTYASLKEEFKDDFIFRGYYLEEQLVGFMSALINKDTLDAHYVGLSYELNKAHAIYSRMLYDYVRIGIAKKVKYINFGRTAGEIKSTLGAVPQELTCYIRHKKSVANLLFKPLLRKVKPKVFEQRHPFKNSK